MPKPDGSMSWDELAGVIGKDSRQVSRWRKVDGAPAAPDPDAWREWLETRSGSPVDPDGLPGVCDYDPAVKLGRIDYTKAHKREQVVEQAIINDIKREELRKIRGDALTKEQHRERLKAFLDRAREAVNRLPDLAAEGVPPHQVAEAKKRARAWADTILTAIAAGLNAAG